MRKLKLKVVSTLGDRFFLVETCYTYTVIQNCLFDGTLEEVTAYIDMIKDEISCEVTYE